MATQRSPYNYYNPYEYGGSYYPTGGNQPVAYDPRTGGYTYNGTTSATPTSPNPTMDPNVTNPAPAPAPKTDYPQVVDYANVLPLAGFESSKLNAEHAAESPKYAFALEARKGGSLPDILKRLQAGPYGAFFNGWQVTGDDTLRYMGSSLNPAFNGIGQFDVIRDVGGPNSAYQWMPSGPWGHQQGGGSIPSFSPIPGVGGSYGFGGGGGSSSTNARSGPAPLSPSLQRLQDLTANTLYDSISAGGIRNPAMDHAQAALEGLIASGGKFDDSIANRRLESVREALDRQRKSQVDTVSAELANRGLLSVPGIAQGPEVTALNRIEQGIAEQYGGAARDIFSNELDAANTRYANAITQLTGLGTTQASQLITLLQTAGALTGQEESYLLQKLATDNNMSIQQAQLALDQAKLAAQTALEQSAQKIQRYQIDTQYSLGLGNLGLNRDIAQNSLSSSDLSSLIQLIGQLGGASQTGAGGYY